MKKHSLLRDDYMVELNISNHIIYVPKHFRKITSNNKISPTGPILSSLSLKTFEAVSIKINLNHTNNSMIHHSQLKPILTKNRRLP